MKNWDGFNISSLYFKVVNEYEKIIEKFSYQYYGISKYERVYLIQDVFVVYVGLINYGCIHNKKYMVVFEEILDNNIFKFNFSGFARKFSSADRLYIVYKRFHGFWGEAIRDINDFNLISLSEEEIEKLSYYQINSRCEYIETKLPKLRLRERYNQWAGYLYNFIIYELSEGNKTGYALYYTKNPHVHRIAREKANDVERVAMYYYSTISSMDESIIGTENDCSRHMFEKGIVTAGVNCDGVIIDLLVDRIERYKAEGWVHKKNVSSTKYCIAEYDLKYFWIQRYIKTPKEVSHIANEIFNQVHNGKYSYEPRYEYLIPENKWKSEQLVYEYTKKLYKSKTVLYQYRPFFLRSPKGQMSYDIFICGLNVAIEYQGKQHFEPVDIFGGEEHFNSQIERDRLKKELSDSNGIVLIYINYWEDISMDLIRSKVEEALRINKK